MIISTSKNIARAFFGSSNARLTHQKSLISLENYLSGIESISRSAGELDSEVDENPIFIFSAGWRSGSTLLQRLVCSAENTVIWGEAYDRCNLIQSLAATAAPFCSDWPASMYMEQPNSMSELSNSWVANLYPPPDALKRAYRGFLLELFARPAQDLGAVRWGLKEVRFGLREAIFLRWIFPASRFLFIRREQNSAYISYKRFSPSMDWYAKWPSKRSFTPFAFASHRARLIKEFEQAASYTGGLILDYEQLLSKDFDIDEIADYCGIDLDISVLSRRVGSGDERPGASEKKISVLEKALMSIGELYGRLY